MALPQPPSYPSARLIAELAREAQVQQLKSIDALDTKAATLIGFGGVLLGLVFTSSVATDHWSAALTIGIATLTISIVGLLALLLPRRYRYDPNIVALSKRFLDQPEEETLRVVIDSIELGLAFNADILKWKVRLLNGFAALAVAGIVILSVALLYAVN